MIVRPRPATREGRHRRRRSRRRWPWILLLAALGLAVWESARTGPSTLPPPQALPEPPQANATAPLTGRTPFDPKRFPIGTCELLRPVPSAPIMVALDAGHGRGDPGASGTNRSGERVLEKNITQAVVDAAAIKLQRKGIGVVLTRSREVGTIPSGGMSTAELQRELTLRARCANSARAATLVSVHTNSFADRGVGGTETVYEQHRELADSSRRLAQLLQTNILDGLGPPLGSSREDRGLVDDSAGGETTGGHLVLLGPSVPGYIDAPTAMPSALIEPAFITNPDDATLLSSQRGVDALATAVTRAVDQFVRERRPS